MKKTVKLFFKKGDPFLFILIFVITIIPIFINFSGKSIFENAIDKIRNSKQKFDQVDLVEINYNRNIIKYKIDEDRIIKLKDDKIIVEIKEKKVRVLKSDCPDKLCIKKGWINKAGQFIICMPNKLVIKLIGKEEYDGITY